MIGNYILFVCLQASGGSGTYIWTSTNTTVGSVNTKGLVMTTSGIGHTQVKAADTRNMGHFGTVEVRRISN